VVVLLGCPAKIWLWSKRTRLGDAYWKAGVAFRGQLEQNFVVLHDQVLHPNKEQNDQLSKELNVGTPIKRLRDEAD
jgi:hypothetical protein